jgi:CubicO group peptidase (beta-lactamase class C family)
MNKIEKKFTEKLTDKWVDVTPSMQIQAYQAGKKKLDLSFGDEYKYYDLASLTKGLFTGRAMMTLFADKKCNKATLVQDILPWWPHRNTNLFQLLTHSSGMIWWKPYYEELRKLPAQSKARFSKLGEILKNTPLVPSAKSVYSDSGFLLLGLILQELEQQSLLELWLNNQDRWKSKNNLHFRPLFADAIDFKKLNSDQYNKNFYPDLQYAPTERCPWQNKLLQGVAHDENARALGGIAPHAGLFGGAADVSQYLLSLRKIIREENKRPVISSNVLSSFVKRAIPKNQGDWALGWMMPTKGASSSGQFFSPTSVGHTGFTGTSMWWDLKKDIIIVILSNRVNLGRENKSFAQLRPLLHDFIIESLED